MQYMYLTRPSTSCYQDQNKGFSSTKKGSEPTTKDKTISLGDSIIQGSNSNEKKRTLPTPPSITISKTESSENPSPNQKRKLRDSNIEQIIEIKGPIEQETLPGKEISPLSIKSVLFTNIEKREDLEAKKYEIRNFSLNWRIKKKPEQSEKPIQPSKEESSWKWPSFSFGRKEDSKRIMSEEIKTLESQVKSKSISITLTDYDKRNVSLLEIHNIKDGLKKSEEVSLSFSDQIFNEDASGTLFNALSDFIQYMDHNTSLNNEQTIIKDILLLSAQDQAQLRENLKYCALKADSALRNSFQCKHNMFIKTEFMPYEDLKSGLKKLHIEIKDGKITVSRICSVKIHWNYKGKTIITPIDIEYSATSAHTAHTAKILSINWDKETMNKKKAFLEILTTGIDS